MLSKKMNKESLLKPLIIILFIVVLSILKPNSFLSRDNFSNVLWSISTIGIMATGTIFTILIGGIDLSVGSMMAVSGAICGTIIVKYGSTTQTAIFGIIAALIIAFFIGIMQGFIINKFNAPAFLITFAMQIVLSGIAQIILNNKILSVTNPGLFTAIGIKKILGFPLPVYFMIIAMLISTFVLDKTKLGRRVYAVGGNPVAAQLSGINSRKIVILTYGLSALTAAIAGIVLSSMTQQSMASAGSGYDTKVITAIVIGGASLSGGEGKISGCVFGVVLTGLLNNAMNLLNLPATVHPLVEGLVIIFAVALDTYGKNKSGSLPKFFSISKKTKPRHIIER